MKGIYRYIDKQTNEVIYIEKDSNIDKNKRHKAHFSKSRYNAQPINRILQKNPNRYKYEIVYCGNFDNELLNTLEINEIAEYKPKYNFTNGGDGLYGHKLTEEHKQKISRAHKGKKKTAKTREKMSKNNAKYWQGKHFSKEHKKNISNGLLKKYATISKQGKHNNQQRYGIRFKGKIIKKSCNKNNLIKWFLKNYPLEIILIS